MRDYGKKGLASLVAYVPQTHAPSYDYSVFDVALMGALCRTPLFSSFSAADKKLAEQALEKMGIAHLKNAPYTRVSGGERHSWRTSRARWFKARKRSLWMSRQTGWTSAIRSSYSR